MKAKTFEREQLKLQREIIEATGINIVCCGDCGQVLLHKITDEEIECHECGFKSEPCDFPDLNY